MNYCLNGKNIHIPTTEIDKYVDLLNISINEAIQMWLEDEGYLKNAEVEKLTKQAKENKVKLNAHSSKPRKAVKRELKPDEEKEHLISILQKSLENEGYSTKIVNKSKIIEFFVGDNHYKLDLIKHRPPKS